MSCQTYIIVFSVFFVILHLRSDVCYDSGITTLHHGCYGEPFD